MPECKDFVDYAVRLTELYVRSTDPVARKLKGQFFTPKEVSIYMSELFKIKNDNFRILDPGAGVGILSAAFCNRLLGNARLSKGKHISIDAYENDPDLLPFLRDVLETCRCGLRDNGISLEYRICSHDFILANERHFRERNLTDSEKYTFYDYIISNPPYFKLNKNSKRAAIMRESISGLSNIYALFMALSAKMMKPSGEMVFITPRSFCSGFYYRKFREWFLKTLNIEHIHIFDSRRDVFDKYNVLQENIIVKATQCKEVNQSHVRISRSKTKSFENITAMKVALSDVIFRKKGYMFIRIPSSAGEVQIINLIDTWPKTLHDLGCKISTGPVVPFRTRENLREQIDSKTDVPLLWMQDTRNFRIKWPGKNFGKPQAIEVNESTKHILLPVKNYVLMKRFSSKEQKRRLNATVLFKEDIPYTLVGIENHVNYIYKTNGELSRIECLGLASLLNSSFVDVYFRALNGNSQVNATDVRCLPLPDISYIEEIGETISEKDLYNEIDFDGAIAEVLDIDFSVQLKDKGA